MIPRRLHRIWIGPQRLPAEFAAYGEQWAQLHPGWDITLWTEQEITTLAPLRNQAVWDNAPARDRWRFRADVLRLELLWRFGGIYADTDVEPLRPLDSLLQDMDSDCFAAWSPNPGPGGARVATNAVMGAAAEHPFIDAVIRTLPGSAAAYRGRHTAMAVGPYHLDRTLRAWAGDPVTVYEPAVFYPQSTAARDRGERPDLDGAYTHHRWATSRDRRRPGERRNR